jgi:hypothetical protein
VSVDVTLEYVIFLEQLPYAETLGYLLWFLEQVLPILVLAGFSTSILWIIIKHRRPKPFSPATLDSHGGQ